MPVLSNSRNLASVRYSWRLGLYTKQSSVAAVSLVSVSYGCFPNPTNDWVEAKKTLHRMHWRLRKHSS
ncbi:MAG: hypothetical protein HWQ38_39530 [Nostoc sp. NMS7]|nr:hypothetical protein [Nostoc sp. NMS7]